MWARVVEVMLGFWLMISPFLFGHYPVDRVLWVNDLICGSAVVLLAFLSFWFFPLFRFLRYAHVLIVGVALWLIGFGYVYGGYPASPGYQNDIVLGLVLLLPAIVPNEASQPPPSWRRYYQNHMTSF